LETRALHSRFAPANGGRKSPAGKDSSFSALCWLAGLPEMPRADLRALEENADGQRGARSARVSRGHHSQSRYKHGGEICEGAGRARLRQHVEAAILREDRRRLFSSFRAVGRDESCVAALFCRERN